MGLDVSAPMPNGISLAVKGTTGLPGRSFRSRTFWIGASVAWQTADKNQVTTATGGKLVTCLGNLIAAVTAADARWTLGVLSLSHNGAPRAAGVFTPVTNYSLTDFYFDYQRRRAPQHSRHH